METPKCKEYVTKGLPPPPKVSMTTIPMSGLLVDVYGLDELTPSTPISCFWLLHPRTRTRARMHDIASRVLHAYHQTPSSATRGLIALAFDMPNHGTRLVSEKANESWKGGNKTHAIDMLGMVKGGRVDMSGLMDVVAGYVGRKVEGHVCLGWSLGGHAAWQGWMGEPRLDAAVAIVGCPDFIGLMEGRAKNAKLDCGENLVGSEYFPEDLVDTCQKHDPKAIMLGTTPVPSVPLSEDERTRLSKVLAERGCINGRKLLICLGGEDKLVPFSQSMPILGVLKDVGGVDVQDKVYEGIGHSFSAEMVEDSVRFLVKAVEDGPKNRAKI